MKKKKSVEIDNRLKELGYEEAHGHNIWLDPNAFFEGHVGMNVFLKGFPGKYVVQISTDGEAEVAGSEFNVTVYFGAFGAAWYTVPYFVYQVVDTDVLINQAELFAQREYENRKNKMRI